MCAGLERLLRLLRGTRHHRGETWRNEVNVLPNMIDVVLILNPLVMNGIP